MPNLFSLSPSRYSVSSHRLTRKLTGTIRFISGHLVEACQSLDPLKQNRPVLRAFHLGFYLRRKIHFLDRHPRQDALQLAARDDIETAAEPEYIENSQIGVRFDRTYEMVSSREGLIEGLVGSRHAYAE